MQSSSREVHSSQTRLHPRLGETVLRHRRALWQKPAQAVDGPALAALDASLAAHKGPVVLDSFCGTGMSSHILAGCNPQSLVIGVDKSAQRMGRGGEQLENCVLLRAHCEAVWRHLAERGLVLKAHYVLYPNPWPKPAHLRRRVHGHPAFPLLLQLGGKLELRSNWQLYVEEFGVALHLNGIAGCVSCIAQDEEPLTLFERKYRASGQRLWRLSAQLTSASAKESATSTP